MEWLLFIWSFLQGILPGGKLSSPLFAWRPTEFAPAQNSLTTFPRRSFVGWMQQAPEYHLCARPPGAAHENGETAIRGERSTAGPFFRW
jgi:hypothetical protein